jgi:hypothetical protein
MIPRMCKPAAAAGLLNWEPSASTPDELPLELPLDGEPADDDAADELPAVAVSARFVGWDGRSVSVPCVLDVTWPVSVVAGAGMLGSGGKSIRAKALLNPSPIALTRSVATFPGSSVGISRAGVGSHGGMLRS